MKFNLSKENSKRVLSSAKQIANASQNYLASLNNSAKPTSPWKKLADALLLIPIIVPTSATVALIVCSYLSWNAVSIKENDSKLLKTAKVVAKILIFVIATMILIPCIISNIMISLIPALIFYYINRDSFTDIGTVNEVRVESEEEYNKRIEEEVGKLEQQGDKDQSDIEVIAMKDKQDRTVIAKIVDDDIRDGKGVIRTTEDDRSVTIKGIIAANQFATGFGLQCSLIEEGGVDLQCGLSTRTGADKKQAIERLRENESVRTLLSGNGGILSVEQHGSTLQK